MLPTNDHYLSFESSLFMAMIYWGDYIFHFGSKSSIIWLISGSSVIITCVQGKDFRIKNNVLNLQHLEVDVWLSTKINTIFQASLDRL